MGTRADFYVGRGEDAEWLGSIAFDGYPQGAAAETLLTATSEDDFRTTVADLLARREDATTPEQGWPWPWTNSRTTDYAYAWDGGRLHASCFGSHWFNPRDKEPPEGTCSKTVFPDMSKRQNVTMGPRSGIILVRR